MYNHEERRTHTADAIEDPEVVQEGPAPNAKEEDLGNDERENDISNKKFDPDLFLQAGATIC